MRKGNGRNGHGTGVREKLLDFEFDVPASAGVDWRARSCERCGRQGHCEHGEDVALMIARDREKIIVEGREPGELIGSCYEFVPRP